MYEQGISETRMIKRPEYTTNRKEQLNSNVEIDFKVIGHKINCYLNVCKKQATATT